MSDEAFQFNFSSGIDAATEDQGGGGRRFNRLNYLSLDDGESETIRMLSDHQPLHGTVVIQQHVSAPTREAPPDWPENSRWPEAMSGICRIDKTFGGGGDKALYPDCYCCIKWKETGVDRDWKPKRRTWGLAVLRKPVYVDGRIVAMRDQTETVEVDGKDVEIPVIVILNFASNNFWDHFVDIDMERGTWCDIDITITRDGEKIKTDYKVKVAPEVDTEGRFIEAMANARLMAIAKASDEGITSKELAEKGQLPPEPGETLDFRDMETVKPYLLQLGFTEEQIETADTPQQLIQQKVQDLVVNKSSDEYFARFFDTRVAHPETKKKKSEGDEDSTPPPAAKAEDPPQESLDDLASRVQAYSAS